MGLYTLEIWTPGINATAELVADITGIAKNISFSVAKNSTQQLQFQLDLGLFEDLADDINQTSYNLLSPGQNEVRVRLGGTYLLGLKIYNVDADIDGDKKKIDVKCVGMLKILSDVYAGLTTPRVFSGAVDQGTIIKTLIDEAQAESNGDLGIQTSASYIDASANRTDVELSQKSIRKLLVEYASNEYGFDFEFTYDKKFYIHYPYMGLDRRSDVVFEYPKNLRAFGASKDLDEYFNKVLVRGANNGTAQLTATAQATSPIIPGNYVKIVDYADVDDQDLLDDLAEDFITAHGNQLFQLPKYTFDGANSPVPGRDYWIGDLVGLSVVGIPYLKPLEDFIWRVEEIKVKLNDNNDEVIDVKVSRFEL